MSTPIDRQYLVLVLSSLVLVFGAPVALGQRANLSAYDTPAYLEFSSPSYQVSEDQTNAVITVVRTGEFRIPVSVSYSTLDGTAQAGLDYTAVSGTLLIPAGVGLATFLVPVAPDGLTDGPETVQLNLSHPGPNGMIIRPSATLTILDSVAARAAPMLTVRADGHGHILISWPASAAGCVLERSDSATGGVWLALAATPQVADGSSTVTEPALASQFFYRLKQP